MAMSLPPELKLFGEGKMNREKAYLRRMFEGEIHEDVLWRQKAMQCEGVGENWVAYLQDYCSSKVTDAAMAGAAARFPINPPQTKEELYYREIFESHYSGFDEFVHVWDGGCRAGGAAWQSDAYTREGLADVSALSHGLQQ
jgi:asparagine synthase (glutamine-hydrolysing)